MNIPTPWTYDKAYREIVRKTGDGDYQPIGTFHNAPTPEDVEFLLRAVNAHEELLAHIKRLHEHKTLIPNECGVCTSVAKAEGKP